MSLAKSYDLVIVDLDGVVYLGAEAVRGAPEALQDTVDSGVEVAYVTNNASRSAEEVAALLVSLGVPARPDQVLTSAAAVAQLLARDLPPGAPVLIVGAPALRDAIAAVGLRPVLPADNGTGTEPRPVAVVQGWGPDVGWRDLAEACVALRAGATWVATNTDVTLPSPRGPLPGNGSLVTVLRVALSREPDLIVGKPQPVLFHIAAERAGARRTLVVGDRLDTDVEGAARAGMDSLLVFTGVSGAADVLRAARSHRPTYLAADLSALSEPEQTSRVPVWQDGAARADGWVATRRDRALVLAADRAGGGGAVGAARVLAAAAWAHPDWASVEPADPAAERALAEVGLDRFRGGLVRSE